MAKNVRKGTDFTFYIDPSLQVKGQKEFNYSLGRNMADTTSSEDGEWTSKTGMGGRELTGSVTLFLLPDCSININYFVNAWWNNLDVSVSFKPVVASDCSTLYGPVGITNIKPSGLGSATAPISFEISFESTGAFILK